MAKQLCIAADFEVHKIGPGFTAENSNTHKYLAAYTRLDVEMAIQERYNEALEVMDAMLKYILQGIYECYGDELKAVKKHFPHEIFGVAGGDPTNTFHRGSSNAYRFGLDRREWQSSFAVRRPT